MALPEKVIEVFHRASIIENKKPYLWRKDKNGNTMYLSDYLNLFSNYGWEIRNDEAVSYKESL